MPAHKKYHTEAARKVARRKSVRASVKRFFHKKHNGITGRRKYTLRKYGLTAEDYNQIYIAQQGCCAICGKHQSEFKQRLAVDHNHTTNKVRGLLCVSCNTCLGHYEKMIGDKKAIAYLEMYNAE